MPKFRRKIQIIEAVQFKPENKPWPENVKVSDKDFWGGECLDKDGEPNFYYFDGKQDAYQIFPGHWIIKNNESYQWAWSDEYLKKNYDLLIFKDDDGREEALVWDE